MKTLEFEIAARGKHRTSLTTSLTSLAQEGSQQFTTLGERDLVLGFAGKVLKMPGSPGTKSDSERSAPMCSWRNPRALQFPPAERSSNALRRAHLGNKCGRAGCSESASGIWIVIWIVISSFGIARLHFVDSGIDIVTLV